MTSEKMEYVCKTCDKTKNVWGKLVCHTADVHYKCLLCQEKFSSKKKAKQHLNKTARNLQCSYDLSEAEATEMMESFKETMTIQGKMWKERRERRKAKKKEEQKGYQDMEEEDEQEEHELDIEQERIEVIFQQKKLLSEQMILICQQRDFINSLLELSK